MENIILSLIYQDRKPTSDDDLTQNYLIGQTWFHTIHKTYYVCLSNEEGNAIWEKVKTLMSSDDKFRVGFAFFAGNNNKCIINTGLDKLIEFASVTPIEYTYGELGQISINICNNLIEVQNSGNFNGLFSWFVAGYNAKQYNMALKVINGGYVEDITNNIYCENECYYNFPQNTHIELTANSNTSLQFNGWETSTSIDPTDFIINTDVVIVANFEIIYFTLTIEKTGNGLGRVLSNDGFIQCGYTCQNQYSNGSSVELIAIPDNGFQFDGWIGVDSSSGSTAIVEINADKTIEAIFKQEDQEPTSIEYTNYTVTVSKNINGGQINSGDGYIVCGSNCFYEYEKYTVIELIAAPDDHYEFINWSGDVNSDSLSMDLVVDQDLDIIANFQPVQCKVNIIVEGNGYVNGDILCVTYCEQYIDYNTTITLHANAIPNTHFQEWFVDGISHTTTTLDVLIQSNEIVIECYFLVNSYNVNIDIVGSGKVQSPDNQIVCDASCSYTYPYGQNIYLDVITQPGEIFNKWILNSTDLFTPNLMLLVNQDLNIIANFIADNVLLVQIQGNGSVISNDSNINCPTVCQANYGSSSTVVLTANPELNNLLKYWTGFDDLDESGNCIVEMTGNKTVVANFEINPSLISYGYICAGQASGTLYDTIHRFTFPLDSGTITDLANLTQSKRGSCGNNSSTHFYIYGGRTFGVNINDIEKFDFSWSAGSSQNVSNLSASKFGLCANNSLNYGYICNGAYYDVEYVTFDTIERFDFSNDTGNANNIASISISKYLSCANNSSNYGYVCGGWFENGNIRSNIDRFSFYMQFTESSQQDTLSNEKCESACNNSSIYGYVYGGVHYSSTSAETFFNNIDRFQFPLEASNCGNINTLSSARKFSSANNASNYGYICTGEESNVFGVLSSVDRISFAMDSGVVSQISTLNSTKYKTTATDGTDFTNLFI